ncbi:MAG: sigma-70 family RNA polymerase sigma factor [Clostridia bacterium]|nr:sigma-70 family RNA polymerase sigma factor [Clostridia bacterium]
MLPGLLLLLKTDEERIQFARFFNDYESLMFKSVRQVVQSQEDCEDAVQNTCRYLIDRFDELFADGATPSANYIAMLAKNRARDLLRANSRNASANLDDYEDLASEPSEQESAMDLKTAFYTLPEHYQQVLTLFYYEDLSVREIADTLSLSVSAVKKLLQRSRDALRSRLLAEGGENA